MIKEWGKESESRLNLKAEPYTTKEEKDMKLTQYLQQKKLKKSWGTDKMMKEGGTESESRLNLKTEPYTTKEEKKTWS